MNRPAAERIRASFRLLSPRLDALVSGFYARLFEQHPELRPLFPADMDRQKFHLGAALALIVRNIDCLPALERSLMDLGAQHAAVGVRPDHYEFVREALLHSIATQSGLAWTDQLRSDWTLAIDTISAAMMEGAARSAPQWHAR